MTDFEAVDRHLEENLDDRMEELTRLCRVPSVSARHEAIEQCADLVAELLRRRGFEADVLASSGHPVVVAHVVGANPSRTLLFYNHYDVQPPEPLEPWLSPPFEAGIRDGRIYARGAKDDKGEFVARLAALDALRAVSGRYPCNITFLVEGEEEVGSPNLPEFVERHAGRLKADAAVWEEGWIDATGRPMVTLGVRGLLCVQLNVGTISRDGHSAAANLLPSAAWRLVSALATLKDQRERILVPGFYDNALPPSDRQRELLAKLPSTEEALKTSFGLERLLLGRTGAEVAAAPFEPTCNIAGVTSGYQGPGAKTIVPAAASAKLDFRLVPGQDPDDIAAKLRAHLDAQGFVDVQIEVLGAERAAVVDPDEEDVVRLTSEIAEKVYGKPALISPLSGGTTPMYLFTERGVPIVAPGVGFGVSNLAHSPNENMRLVDFHNAARHLARFVERFSAG